VYHQPPCAAWLRANAHLLTALAFHSSVHHQVPRMVVHTRAMQAFKALRTAAAAAAAAKKDDDKEGSSGPLTAAARKDGKEGSGGGLQRLQHLTLPFLGLVPLPVIADTLAACPQLRTLQLGRLPGGKWPAQGGGSTNKPGEVLGAALGQLTHLTSLSLGPDLFDYYKMDCMDLVMSFLTGRRRQVEPTLHALVAGLPASLVTLNLGGGPAASSKEGSGEEGNEEGNKASLPLCVTSLTHLVNLQHLSLGGVVRVTTSDRRVNKIARTHDIDDMLQMIMDRGHSHSDSDSDSDEEKATATTTATNSSSSSSSSSSNSLAALTALTSLDYPWALQQPEGKEPGSSQFPLLDLPNLVQLRATGEASREGLLKLASKTAATLRSLTCRIPAALEPTHFTHLTGLTSLGLRVDMRGAGPQQVRAWYAALGSLTSLQRLTVTAAMLTQLGMFLRGPLTGITHLRIDAGAKPQYTQDMLQQQLKKVKGCVGGGLQVVEVVGVEAGWQQACRAAVAAVVGPGVAVEFP
jgi:hypothetical protein